MTQTSGHFSKPATSLSTSALPVTPPVGLAGELRINSRVFGVISLRVSSAEKAKPFSSRIGIHDLDTGFAEHQDRHEHGRLAARHNHHAVRRDFDLEPLVQVGSHRL